MPDGEKGDRLAASSGVKVPVGWVKCPVRSVRGASNSTGRSEQRTSEAAKPSPHRKRMMGILGGPSQWTLGEGQSHRRRNRAHSTDERPPGIEGGMCIRDEQ